VAPAPAGHLSTPAPADLLGQSFDEYRIAPSDLVEISVFQVPELSKTVRVGVSGTVTLPLIGLVNANGLTGRELEALIAGKLREKYMQDPQVSVFIKEYTSQRLTVEGSVNKPGVFPISGKTTLLQAIAMAGGLDKVADENDVKIFRDRADGTRETIQYDLEPIRQGAVKDPFLMANDMVVVGKSSGRATFNDAMETLRSISIFGMFF
jgi:polysaccharide export outer membrane protein